MMIRTRRNRRFFVSMNMGTMSHPRADGHHGRAALDLRLSRVLHPGALREDQQIPSLLQALNGGFHRQNVRVAPIHGKSPHVLKDVPQNGDAQQLLLGHDAQGVVRCEWPPRTGPGPRRWLWLAHSSTGRSSGQILQPPPG